MFLRLTAILVLAAACALPAAAQSPQPSRPRIGLALGGGSARGMAHIGILRWFEEHRIPVDVVSGTSMGGLIGGAFATGRDSEEIARQMRTTDWDAMFQADSPFEDKTLRRKQDRRAFPSQLEFGIKHGFRFPDGLNPGQQVELMLDEIALPYYDLGSFDELPTPFRCVATDLHTAEAIVLGSGRLSRAMRATMSLPGIFTPVEDGNRLLVDGGMLNNVPADVARSMGADIVIAVDVGKETEEEKRAQSSMFTLLGKTIDTMIRAWTRKAVESATLVIYPDLNGFNSLSWRQSDELASRGYEAADRMADQLLKYAVSEPEYLAWKAARSSRRRTTLPTITRIDVRGVSNTEQALIRRTLNDLVGRPLEAGRVANDLLLVTGTDRYECLSYHIEPGPSGAALAVDVQPKSYGPPFLTFSANANNMDASNFAVDLAGRMTMYDIAGQGSELRVDGVVGTNKVAAAELYVPIGGTPFFVAPQFAWHRSPFNFYLDDKWIGTYVVNEVGGGADVGIRLGRRAEARAGFGVYDVRGRLKIGSPDLPEAEGTMSFASMSFMFDGQDSPIIPSHGLVVALSGRRYFSEPSVILPSVEAVFTNPEHFWQAEAAVSLFHTIHRQDRLFTVIRGGSSFGANPLLNDFSLGGPFKMGAFDNGELRGPNYLYGAGGYLRRVARLPDVLGGNIHVGAWLEAGSVFTKLDSATWQAGVSTGAILETLLGPVFVGGSVASGGHARFYIAMGPTFR